MKNYNMKYETCQSQQIYSFSTEFVHSNITREYIASGNPAQWQRSESFSVLWIPTVEKANDGRYCFRFSLVTHPAGLSERLERRRGPSPREMSEEDALQVYRAHTVIKYKGHEEEDRQK